MTNTNNEKPTPPGTGLFQSKFAASVPAIPSGANRTLQQQAMPVVAGSGGNTLSPPGATLPAEQRAATNPPQPGWQRSQSLAQNPRPGGTPLGVAQPPANGVASAPAQPFAFKPFQPPAHQAPMQPMQPPVSMANSVFAPGTAMVMNERMFEEYRQYIYKLTGILFTETKKYLLEGRIGKRLTVNNMKSFEQYLDFIKNPATAQTELPALYEAITINETYFFRSEQQVEAMEKILIPEILKKKVNPGVFKIWSAASSTGEEAYTMAMVINEKIKPMFPNTQFQIIGTDINNAVIDSARKAVYREYAVRNVPPPYMQKYFVKNGDFYHLSDTIRRMVQFNYLNLYDSPSMKQMQSFDVIFCCNVLIYFDLASKQQVVASLYDALNKGGYLFIGYSESLHGISKAFELVHLPRALAYQKV